MLAGLYIVPWQKFGVNAEWLNKPYTLWLDLQGGVELDYQVDLDSLRNKSWSVAADGGVVPSVDENTIVEWLKAIIDKRVNSLGLAEPTIQTVKYGNDTHIIVQIPTKSYSDLSPEDQEKQRNTDIQNAKATIGKVVQLEFREQKTTFTDADHEERRKIAVGAYNDLKDSIPFDTVAEKYSSQYSGVQTKSGSGSLPTEIAFSGVEDIHEFPYISPVYETAMNASYTIDESGKPVVKTSTGYTVTVLKDRNGDNSYDYSFLTVDGTPDGWTPAMTKDGKILNDQYLLSAGVGFNNVGQPQVELVFNDQWKAIFAELTQRLIGKPIAIFVGWDLLTAPVVQSVIPDGRAVITGQWTLKETQALADNINTGIVPAPIYLTSERTIDAKIGATALQKILVAGVIGLVVIIVFLTVLYRLGGLLAGIALIAYTIFLVAIIKFSGLFGGVVLTLASIAGIILSIGLAIDANILIFELVREALREGHSLPKAIRIGFDQSWTAIWDSHITSFVSALILWIFGIAMIKWFGLMLWLGIVLSLFTAMWVSRVLIQFVSQYIKNPGILVGSKK